MEIAYDFVASHRYVLRINGRGCCRGLRNAWQELAARRKDNLVSLAAILIYFGALLGVSFASYQKQVKLREEFCIWEFCFSATDVQMTKTIGSAGNQSTANGMYYIVRVNIRSDAKRVTQRLQPGAVGLQVVDDKGLKYGYSIEGQKALDESEKNPSLALPWFRGLGPGESSEREIVFDLPVDSNNPQLEITEGQWPTYLVIGDENSFFHKKTRIRLNYKDN